MHLWRIFEVPEVFWQNSTFIVMRAPSLAEGLDPPLSALPFSSEILCPLNDVYVY